MNKGTRVRRGIDWRYGGQDCKGGKPCEGTVISKAAIRIGNHYYVRVQWDNGYKHLYRIKDTNDKPVYDLAPVGAVSKFFSL